MKGKLVLVIGLQLALLLAGGGDHAGSPRRAAGYTLGGGFWRGGALAPLSCHVYLPLTMHDW